MYISVDTVNINGSTFVRASDVANVCREVKIEILVKKDLKKDMVKSVDKLIEFFDKLTIERE